MDFDDGAVFWMDPLAAPRSSSTGHTIVEVGQLTVPSSFSGQAAFLMQGHTDRDVSGETSDLTLSHPGDLTARNTWDEYGIFEILGGSAAVSIRAIRQLLVISGVYFDRLLVMIGAGSPAGRGAGAGTCSQS